MLLLPRRSNSVNIGILNMNVEEEECLALLDNPISGVSVLRRLWKQTLSFYSPLPFRIPWEPTLCFVCKPSYLYNPLS